MSIMRNITLLTAATMTIMAGATIAPALPDMQTAFSDIEGSELLVKLVLTIPALVIALSAMSMGALADRFGRKPVLLASLALYAVAGTSGYWLQSLQHILLGRALLGAAVAGVMTSTTALVGDYFKGPALSKFMGIQTSVIGIGGFVFLSLGGFLAEQSWRLPFTLYLFSLVVVPFAMLFLTGSKAQATLPVEAKVQSKRYNWAGLLIAFVGMTAFYMLPTQLPFLLADFDTLNTSDVGLVIASMTLATSATSLLYAKLKNRLSFNGIFALVFAALAIGIGLIGSASSHEQAVAGVIISGIGAGLLMPNLNVWFVSQSSVHNRGKVIGALTTAMFLGQFSSPLVVTPIQSVIGLNETFSVIAVFLISLAIVFATISGRQQQRASA